MKKKQYKKPQITIEQLEQQLVEVNTALWQANKQLEAEQKSKSELLSNLSHDLRAPLAALRSTVELLQSKDTISTDERHTLLNIMDKRLSMLETMINDLFLLTHIENLSVKPETEAINAGIFIEEYFYACTVDNKFEKRHLNIDVPDDFPYFININVQHIIRVLDNLMTNALRYSKDGDTITLSVKSKTSDILCIIVEDTGKGISPDDIIHIFERSFRADRSRTPLDGGSGLGLAIAKGIIEQHNGKIYCESTPGEGSCFIIELPCFTI